ncbi:thiamine-repressible mitochondrial transport protein THI74 [Cucurbita pepo subsp. pepo]|uniref:thiamine-repressible mitochondrial transport protein THI74 n=1 Tax=Cucurbita pepo subsp. pepo TaxID=3664 RepID=UPI000C9DA2F4|nr:thiamine-repressible mitochondrial transport protein THI74 [Cucurbita pepo subsp. pepo]XP_023511449.1 thiamine-repressible mitochondrial transport protein THI74 [Cucurbita pepo subsp. pepo]
MKNEVWRWGIGLFYIFLVATIWIAASFVVQSVVDEGVSPFLVTYICNSLFVIYIPIVEIARFLEDKYGSLLFWKHKNFDALQELREEPEQAILLGETDLVTNVDHYNPSLHMHLEDGRPILKGESILSETGYSSHDKQVDEKGRWTRMRVAKVSLLICPFWFLAQLTFNLSLKYTTVTSNTILSSASSLFTFLVSLAFLGEKFTWVKLASVLLCMGGTIIVSLGDSQSETTLKTSSNPLLGDVLSLVSAGLYAVYITLIRKKLPDDDETTGKASMAQFLGFLGLFNLVIFLPVALIIKFAQVEPFHLRTWKEVGMIVAKGLLDNVLSDYLWAKAVLLTTTTVATAGLTIQVPLAAIVDSITGNAPHLMDYLGAVAVMIGFIGINIPTDAFSCSKDASIELPSESVISDDHDHSASVRQESASVS